MFDTFDLPVTSQGEELLFPARLQQVGYIHRFVVDVYGQKVFFEPDEERNYRAILEADKTGKHITLELLSAIADGIGAIIN